MSIPCILIPALVGLISGALGYLLGSSFSAKGGDNGASLSLQSDLDACRANSKNLSARIASLEAELASAKASASSQINSLVSPTVGGQDGFPWNADMAFTAMGKKIKQDDLKIVEGIGPKIEELYNAAGISTWKALSETTVEKSQAILDAAGERFSVHNPSTWARQAEMAYHGKWDELKAWQDTLDGGKE
jgi:predicted flap endonuclease-1-like 5' DNA nuclease